jgi:hypothetical protein
VPVFLTGTLIIDVPANLINYTFLMAEDAEIRLNNNITLTLASCTLKAACDTLWSRIYVPNSSATLNVYGGVIRDAVYGLWSQNSAKIVASGVTFADNIYSVRLRDGIPAPNDSYFQGCTFTSTTTMLLPSLATTTTQLLQSFLYPNLIFTSIPTRPYVGIEGWDCSKISIGDPAGFQNVFEKMDFGIRINRNSTVIKNNLFRNINRLGMNNTTTGDKAAIVYEGVDADSVKIKIGGDLLNELNIIEDCANGYIGTGCTRQLIIANNQFSRIDNRAITVLNGGCWYVNNNLPWQIINNIIFECGNSITSNPFPSAIDAIRLAYNPYIPQIKIHNNRVYAASNSCLDGSCIRVIETPGSNAKFEITWNILERKKYGIFTSGLTGSLQADNTIFMESSSIIGGLKAGIFANTNHFATVIQNNSIRYNNLSTSISHLGIGIETGGGSDFGILCNYIRKAGTHLRYLSAGSSVGTSQASKGILGNTFDEGMRGIGLSVGNTIMGTHGIPGDQGNVNMSSSNKWNQQIGFPSYHAFATSTYWPYFWVPLNDIDEDFRPNIQMNPGMNISLLNFHVDFVASNFVPYVCPGPTNQVVSVLRIAEEDTTIEEGGSRIGDASEIFDAWSEADFAFLSGFLEDTLKFDELTIWNKKQQILRRIIKNPEWADSIPLINQFVSQLTNDNAYKIAKLQIAIEENDSIQFTSYLMGIENGYLPDENLKQVYQIWNQSQLVGNLTSADSTALLDIAYQCQNIGGYGVSMARNLIGIEVDEDMLGCFGNERLEFSNNLEAFESITVFPNPVSEECILSGVNFSDSGIIKMYNSFGQLSFEIDFLKETITNGIKLPVKNCVNGVYFISVITEKGTIIRKSIIINK